MIPMADAAVDNAKSIPAVTANRCNINTNRQYNVHFFAFDPGKVLDLKARFALKLCGSALFALSANIAGPYSLRR